jgi:hypothetical protein
VIVRPRVRERTKQHATVTRDQLQGKQPAKTTGVDNSNISSCCLVMVSSRLWRNTSAVYNPNWSSS